MCLRAMGFVVVLAGLWSGQACAPGAAPDGGTVQPAPWDDETVVQVNNHNWADITVYLVRDGSSSRVRLGSVMSMTEENFDVPRSVMPDAGGIRLYADPIGSRRGYLTEPIQVAPGQRVEWQLENNLRLSSVSVW